MLDFFNEMDFSIKCFHNFLEEIGRNLASQKKNIVNIEVRKFHSHTKHK